VLEQGLSPVAEAAAEKEAEAALEAAPWGNAAGVSTSSRTRRPLESETLAACRSSHSNRRARLRAALWLSCSL